MLLPLWGPGSISRCARCLGRYFIRHWHGGNCPFALSPEILDGGRYSERTVAVFDIDLDINDLKDVKSMELVLEKSRK